MTVTDAERELAQVVCISHQNSHVAEPRTRTISSALRFSVVSVFPRQHPRCRGSSESVILTAKGHRPQSRPQRSSGEACFVKDSETNCIFTS